MMMNFRDDKRKCEEYIRALEVERVKVQVFQRELPLCLELVTQAIEAYKQQLSSNNGEEANNGEEDQCVNGNSECSEQGTSTGNHGPVLEEFIPLKSCNSSALDYAGRHHVQEIGCNKEDIIMDQNDNHDYEINDDNDDDDDDKSIGKKSDWLRSVQLWNQPPDPNTIHEEDGPKRTPMTDLKKKEGGAFQPFQKEKATTTTTCNNNNTNVRNNNSKPNSATAASSSSSAAAATPCTGGSSGGCGGGGKREEKGGQRKARRCWSPELHKRFLHALHQLGGSHVATPKQIRELMKVDGLTNDEVKSHLQKYRLHTARRPSNTNQTTTNPPPPQFVVVGGIWMPPPEYSAMATPTPMNTTPISSSNGVYAPMATMATPMPCSQQQQQHSSPLHCEDQRGCQSDGGVHSNSTSTSSTHTTKTSHVY